MTERKENPWYLGIHTLLPHLQKKPDIYKHIPLLDLNNCKLPPFFIAVGDRRRVRNIVSYLDNGYILEDVILKNDINPNIGRVTIGVGIYKGTPIAVFEHGMGLGSCEIICRELLSPFNSSRIYKTNNKKFNSDAKYIIRVGSCGAINGRYTKKEDMINLADVIVSDRNVGITGCVLQSMTSILNFLEMSQIPEWIPSAKISEKIINEWFIQPTDEHLTKILFTNVQQQTNKKKIKTHLLSNYSKDSLYCEINEDKFINLREKFDVGSTEMELDCILNVSNIFTELGEPVKVGMVCYSLAVIPGILFPDIEQNIVRNSSECAILGALEALHEISLKLLE